MPVGEVDAVDAVDAVMCCYVQYSTVQYSTVRLKATTAAARIRCELKPRPRWDHLTTVGYTQPRAAS
jgi:hypothetical protein